MLFLEILKLFLMCAMGFGIVKAGILKSSDSGPLSAIALYIVCPCVYLADYDPVQARSLLVTFIAAVIIVSACLIICTLLSRPLHLSDVEVTSAAYSNAGNMIIPIISSMLQVPILDRLCCFWIGSKKPPLARGGPSNSWTACIAARV